MRGTDLLWSNPQKYPHYKFHYSAGAAANVFIDNTLFVWHTLIHGGGWVFASMEGVDRNCRFLCNKLECIIASVDYRLAPEHAFPSAAEDSYTAARWVFQNAGEYGGDRNRISVCGDSAGGNLSAVVCQMAKHYGGLKIASQVLIYPVIDLSSTNTGSYNDFADKYLLTRNAMEWLIGMYVPDTENRRNPFASPIHSEDLSGLPPALVVTAEFDPLRDEGYAYARRLQASGVRTDYVCYSGMIHAFFYMSYISAGARAACEDLYGRMKNLLHS